MSTVDLVVKNGRVVTEGGIFHGGVAIDRGKIICVGSDIHLPSADRVIDAKENYVMPGLIDPHTHPGKRDFFTDVRNESLVGAVGGITTMGAIVKSSRMGVGWTDKSPTPVSYRKVFPAMKDELNKVLGIDLYFNFAIVTDEQAREIPLYAKEYGVTSFKFYLGYMGGDAASRKAGLGNFSSRLGLPDGFDDGTVYLGFKKIAETGPPCIAHIHAENMPIVRIFFEEIMKEGRCDLAAWNRRSPPFCEAHHIHSYSYLAKITGCPLYVVHLSTAEGLDEVVKAKNDGVRIVAETGPQWLIIDSHDDPPGSLGKVNPPIRDSRAHEALWWGLKGGHVKCLGTDHVPNLPDQCHGDLLVTPDTEIFKGTGAVGMQTMFPAIFTYGVLGGKISLEELVNSCAANNAKAAGLYPMKGTLSPGADGDVVVMDPKTPKKVDESTIHSKANAFFRGRELRGWPVTTILRGQMVFDGGEITGKPGVGHYLPRTLGTPNLV
ncbi:MAG: amidohydrolase family protein [Thaumarchaeota archaeon]|nr:amidohydrolase family protein [Nitrososphaerota archaeon]